MNKLPKNIGNSEEVIENGKIVPSHTDAKNGHERRNGNGRKHVREDLEPEESGIIIQTRAAIAKANTPENGTKLPEAPLHLEMTEAKFEDIPKIKQLYDKLLFPREWFETLARRAPPGEMMSVTANLSGGGELFPILEHEWKERMESGERILLIRSKPTQEAPEGQIIGVHAYVMPSTEKMKERILKRLNKINEVNHAAQAWLNDAKKEKGDYILMTEDVFTDGSVRNKGLHHEIYRATLEYELSLPEDRRIIRPDELDKWNVYYWVNFFMDAWFKSRGPWMRKETIDGIQREVPDHLKDPPFNIRMLNATTKSQGNIIGYSHKPDSETDYIELPSEKNPKVPHIVTGTENDTICLIRPYMDVHMPLNKFRS